MSFAREVLAAARLDFGEVRRSRWLAFATAVYALLAGVLVLVGMRESSVLGFTGMGRVMLSFAHVLLLVLPLLALSATTQVVNRARDDGTIELLFSHPLSRSAYLVALTFTRYTVLALPLVLLLVAMGVIARLVVHEEVPWVMLGRSIAVSCALLWAFVGIGLAVSVETRNQAKAVVLGLVFWALGVLLLDLALVGLMLEWRVDARALFVLASLNPVQAARVALLSGLEPDLGTLGPVGFYLSHTLGPRALYALGLAWPTAVGTLGWLWAFSGWKRGDLV
ncbi:MAG: ABC transporter permease subunit [Polyangiales bacterium]